MESLRFWYDYFMAHHVIYIPGVRDYRPYGQNIVIQLWRIFGLRPHYVPLGWDKKEGYSVKQARLTGLIDDLHRNGNSVSLIGVSAGASAALNAYAASENVFKVICISGKINNWQTIGRKTFERNPDFEESVKNLCCSLESMGHTKITNIMSIHPWKDQTVPIADTIITGAKEKTLPGWNHVTGIFFGITLGALPIASFIYSRV